MKVKCKFPKLDGRIVEKFGTRGHFADALGITLTSLGRKLNGKSKWKSREIEKACELLTISNENIHVYFFTA